MKLVWKDGFADVGSYELELTTDDGRRRTIHVTDYTCPYHQEQRAKDPRTFDWYHPNDFEVHYCCGYSMKEYFDAPEYDLEKVKIWAEDYLLDGFINYYNQTLKELDELKKNAEQAQAIKNARR